MEYTVVIELVLKALFMLTSAFVLGIGYSKFTSNIRKKVMKYCRNSNGKC